MYPNVGSFAPDWSSTPATEDDHVVPPRDYYDKSDIRGNDRGMTRCRGG